MAEKMKKVEGEKLNNFPTDKQVKILPTFSLTDADLPDIKDWKVGDKYTLVMEVEQISMRQGSEWQGASDKDKKVHATFKILEVGVEEEETDDSSDGYEAEYASRMSKTKK